MSDVQQQIGVLTAGAAAFSRRTAAERGALAERTAQTVAAVADDWVEVALGIKQSTAAHVRARVEACLVVHPGARAQPASVPGCV